MSLTAFRRSDARLVALTDEAVTRAQPHGYADATECLIERLPQAVILVDAKGTVGSLNQRARAIVAQGDGLVIHHGVLRCRHPEDTGALHRLIGDVGKRDEASEAPTRRALRIRRPVGRRSLNALVTALRGSTLPQNGGAVVAVLVKDPEDKPVLDAHMLRAWYDLTPAEARVAVLLATGLSLDEIVERLGIRTNTARTHLKNIFGKTDTRRQGELIRLLLGNPTLGWVRTDGAIVGSTPRTNRASESSPRPGQARAV